MHLYFHAIVSNLQPIDSMAYHGHSPKLTSLSLSKFNEEISWCFQKKRTSFSIKRVSDLVTELK